MTAKASTPAKPASARSTAGNAAGSEFEAFEALAKAICDDSPPATTIDLLAGILHEAAGYIADNARDYAAMPSAEEKKDKLNEAANAARTLSKLLQTPYYLGLLDEESLSLHSNRLDIPLGLFDFLDKVARISKNCANKPAVSGKKLVPNEIGLTPKEQCALIVYRACMVVRSSNPPVRREATLQLCEDFWLLCGQHPKGEALEGWRVHLTKARNIYTNDSTETMATKLIVNRLFDPVAAEMAASRA